MTRRTPLIAAIALAGLAPLTGGAQVVPQGPPPPGMAGVQGRGMGPMQTERKVVEQFDKNGDDRLDAAERRDARVWIESQPAQGPGGRGRGQRGGGVGNMVAPEPGIRLTPAAVKAYASESVYDPGVVRTLFFQFENDDWLAELVAFNNTDVEVPATLTVDGQTFKDVGLHTRGASSFFTVPAGYKQSLNVSIDWVHGKQSLGGYTTLNLLNSHTDPTYLRTVLYLQAAREYVPAPKGNYVRVVLNGENWGVYVSAQQFNKGFIQEWFKTDEGARWKVPGSPNGRGGLEYLGDDIAAYKRVYEIKSKDDPAQWEALARLTRVLNTTPPDQLEQALAPMLNIDGVLKFLALEVALVNNDGYWTRASDYSLYRDPKGVFHLFPHDANETFGPGGGGGRGRGPGGPPPGGRMGPPPGGPGGGGQGRGGMRMGGAELDPLVGLDDATKPLRSKLLAVPALRTQYLRYVKEIATKWLDWKTIGPIAERYQALIRDDVARDTRKLDTIEAFDAGLQVLQDFAARRRAFLMSAEKE
jgi:hypothetical protein